MADETHQLIDAAAVQRARSHALDEHLTLQLAETFRALAGYGSFMPFHRPSFVSAIWRGCLA